jgi:hypothetical protein
MARIRSISLLTLRLALTVAAMAIAYILNIKEKL